MFVSCCAWECQHTYSGGAAPHTYVCRKDFFFRRAVVPPSAYTHSIAVVPLHICMSQIFFCRAVVPPTAGAVVPPSSQDLVWDAREKKGLMPLYLQLFMSKAQQAQKIQRDLKEALGVPGCSEHALFQLWNILRPEDELKETSFKRKVEKELNWDSIREFAISNGSPEDRLLLCDIPSLLRTYAKECPPFAAKLHRSMLKNSGRPLDLIFFADETTGGNIVAPATKLKSNLIRFSFCQLSSLDSELLWLPLGVIQTCQLDDMEQGWVRTWNTIIAKLEEMRLQDGFALEDPLTGETFLFMAQPKYFLGDFAIVANILGHNGAAALKPCPFCTNVCKRDCQLDSFDATGRTVTVTCADPTKFEKMTDADLLRVREILVSAQQESKAKVEQVQKVTGFRPGEQSNWPLSRTLLDTMHLFWHNGMMSWEICMLIKQVLAETALTLPILQQCFGEEWHRPYPFRNVRTANYRKKLLHKERLTGEAYKGNGSELLDLIPLAHHYFEEALRPSGLLTPQLDSLEAACMVVHAYKDVRKCELAKLDAKLDILLRAISKHHTLVQLAYGPTACRPKMHYRFHVVDQIKRFPETRLLDCWSAEKDHGLYKDNLCTRAKRTVSEPIKFQRTILKRLVNKHLHKMEDMPSEARLLPPSSKWEDFTNLCGMPCLVSKTLQTTGGFTCAAGDIFLDSSSGWRLEACLEIKDKLLCLILTKMTLLWKTPLRSRWKSTASLDILFPDQVASLIHPPWWQSHDQEILCLH